MMDKEDKYVVELSNDEQRCVVQASSLEELIKRVNSASGGGDFETYIPFYTVKVIKGD